MGTSMEELLLADDQFPEDVQRNIRSFLLSNFDPQNYSRNILQHSTLSLTEHLLQIEASIAALDSSLKNQVLEDPGQLTVNISTIDLLETSFQGLFSSSSNLLTATEASLGKFRGLFEEYSSRLQSYSKAKKTIDLLRKANRIVQAAKRLRACSTKADFDLAKAAVVVTELGSVYKDVELQEIKFVAMDLAFVKETVEFLPKRIVETIGDAVNKQDLGKIGVAVDACLVFGNVEEVLAGVTGKFIRNIQGLVEDGLDIQQLSQSEAGKNTGSKSLPGRTTLPSVQNTPALRTTFWTKVDGIFDVIYQNQIRIELLESVYQGRYEHHALYTSDMPDIEDGRMSTSFFKAVVAALETGLAKCGRESTFFQQILENEFPRLLKMVKDTTNRLRSASLFLHADNLNALRESVSTFQSLFTSRSLSRLLEPVNAAFSDTATLPTAEDLNGLFRSITNELVVCTADDTLAALICGNIGRALRLAFVKLETSIATDGEATQVIGTLTAKQVRNFKIIDTAYKIKFGVEKILKNNKTALPDPAKKTIEDVLSAYENPVLGVLNPLRESLTDSVESILLTMHDEDFSAGADEADLETVEVLDSTCSLYMRELQDFLNRAQHTFFSQIDITQPLLRSCVAQFARRCLELFIRHTSLVRPVGKQGRLKLAGDFAQLDAALAPLNLTTTDYGKELAIAKAFRPLLFQSPVQIAANPIVGTVVAFSVVLHHLFSRAPVDLHSPAKVMGWSISRYSRYLDEHPKEVDRLGLIAECLDAYAKAVRERGETHYAVIYPLMRDVLAKSSGHG